MFLAWAIMNGLEGDLHKEESANALAAVRERRMMDANFSLSSAMRSLRKKT